MSLPTPVVTKTQHSPLRPEVLRGRSSSSATLSTDCGRSFRSESPSGSSWAGLSEWDFSGSVSASYRADSQDTLPGRPPSPGPPSALSPSWASSRMGTGSTSAGILATPRGGARAAAARGSDELQRLIAPGDVFYIAGGGTAAGAGAAARRLSDLGSAGGLLGHVLVVLAPPRRLVQGAKEGVGFELESEGLWPTGVAELWLVRTLESTRQQRGLWEAEVLLRVDPVTGRLILFGELGVADGQLVCQEDEELELWQSPKELRGAFRADLMVEVIAEMKRRPSASWSFATAARAVFRSASAFQHRENKASLMEEIRGCWTADPICTSVVIIFWQLYLYKAASHLHEYFPELPAHPADLILRFMPLKADRGLPGDLVQAMRQSGFTNVTAVPRDSWRPAASSAATPKAQGDRLPAVDGGSGLRATPTPSRGRAFSGTASMASSYTEESPYGKPECVAAI